MKGLILRVFRNGGPDSSNGGISARCSQVVLVGPGVPQLTEATDDRPAVHLVIRKHLDYVHAEPLVEGPHSPFMSGGCFVSTTDSRFGELLRRYGFAYAPAVPLHDRTEG